MTTTNYRNDLDNPSFLHSNGATMPNLNGWQDRHRAALRLPTGFEIALVHMLRGWAEYADKHSARYESGIGDDGVIGLEWENVGKAILGLFDGDCGRLDAGTLDSFVRDTLKAEGFSGE